MHIVLVHIHVKPERVDDFMTATRMNASQSVKEAGISRFDVVQQKDDPTKFILIEVYRSVDATADHKETEHYKVWKASVEDMLVEARTRSEYVNVYPPDSQWR